MTCIVGVEINGKAYVGGDSAAIGGLDITIRNDSKVFKVGEMIMGFTDSFRMGQLLRYKLSLPVQAAGQDDYEYLCTDFIDAVITCLEANGYSRVKDNEKVGGTFIVAFKNSIYVIYSDFQVEKPLDGYQAIGCGGPYARGAISALIGLEPDGEKLVRRALEISALHSSGVAAPFTVVAS
jgi:ATP-dependent protease HslVU (ClpYQ) peptidase subunit